MSPRKRTAENSPAIQRPCQNSEILENGPLKSFAVIEKRLTGQISPKIFSGSFFIRVLTQPLQRRVGSTKQSRRVATAEKSLRILGESVVATRQEQITTRSPALKRRAKVTPTLRVEVT